MNSKVAAATSGWSFGSSKTYLWVAIESVPASLVASFCVVAPSLGDATSGFDKPKKADLFASADADEGRIAGSDTIAPGSGDVGAQ